MRLYVADKTVTIFFLKKSQCSNAVVKLNSIINPLFSTHRVRQRRTHANLGLLACCYQAEKIGDCLLALFASHFE